LTNIYHKLIIKYYKDAISVDSAAIKIINSNTGYSMRAKLFIVSIIIPVLFLANSDANNIKNIPIIEEDKVFWDTLLNEKKINNKNLLYASYIAYKDRLNSLSIETFQECIKTNSSNSVVSGISAYYIGKNLYFIGK